MTFFRSTWLIDIPNKSRYWKFNFSFFYFFLNRTTQPFIQYPSSLNKLLLTTRPAKFAGIRRKSLLRIFIPLLDCSDTFSNPRAPQGVGQLLYACLIIVQYHWSPYPCLQNVDKSIQIYQISAELNLIHNIKFSF